MDQSEADFHMATAKRAALYLRVSTDDQTVDNQRRELEAAAAARGWVIVETYVDEGISGAKGRDQRPQLDRILKDAVRRKFDVVMVWAVDRLGRSLADLIGSMQELAGAKVDLFLLQQGLDTTTAAGRAMYQMLRVFSEFERTMIVSRINAGIARVRATGKTKSGKAIGRPRVAGKTLNAAKAALAAPGASIRIVAAATGLSVGKVAAIRKEMAA
jgi:DNA invertase Pin-like site-specific DNA recombinase